MPLRALMGFRHSEIKRHERPGARVVMPLRALMGFRPSTFSRDRAPPAPLPAPFHRPYVPLLKSNRPRHSLHLPPGRLLRGPPSWEAILRPGARGCSQPSPSIPQTLFLRNSPTHQLAIFPPAQFDAPRDLCYTIPSPPEAVTGTRRAASPPTSSGLAGAPTPANPAHMRRRYRRR
jgi:hypothetical protein